MLSPAIIEALAIGNLPDQQWDVQDDLCDCTYQRIGMWKNIYLAETLEVRLCCLWAELYKQYPQFLRVIPAYWNENTKEWETEPKEWNGESEMPKAIWYRHLARKLGRTVADIRAEYADRDELRPKGTPKPAPIPFILLDGGNEIAFDLANWRLL
jgi:hypothetical protein